MVAAILETNGGAASPLKVEAVCSAGGYGDSEVRSAFTALGLRAVTDPHGRVLWTTRRAS
jgi:hypothetical protein